MAAGHCLTIVQGNDCEGSVSLAGERTEVICPFRRAQVGRGAMAAGPASRETAGQAPRTP